MPEGVAVIGEVEGLFVLGQNLEAEALHGELSARIRIDVAVAAGRDEILVPALGGEVVGAIEPLHHRVLSVTIAVGEELLQDGDVKRRSGERKMAVPLGHVGPQELLLPLELVQEPISVELTVLRHVRLSLPGRDRS